MDLGFFSDFQELEENKDTLKSGVLYDVMIMEIFKPKPKAEKKPSIIVCYSVLTDGKCCSYAEYVPFNIKGKFKSLLEAIVKIKLTEKNFGKDFDLEKLVGKCLGIRFEDDVRRYLKVFKYSPVSALMNDSKKERLKNEYERVSWVEIQFGNQDLPETEENINNLLDATTKKSEVSPQNEIVALPEKQEQKQPEVPIEPIVENKGGGADIDSILDSIISQVENNPSSIVEPPIDLSDLMGN